MRFLSKTIYAILFFVHALKLDSHLSCNWFYLSSYLPSSKNLVFSNTPECTIPKLMEDNVYHEKMERTTMKHAFGSFLSILWHWNTTQYWHLDGYDLWVFFYGKAIIYELMCASGGVLTACFTWILTSNSNENYKVQ